MEQKINFELTKLYSAMANRKVVKNDDFESSVGSDLSLHHLQ